MQRSGVFVIGMAVGYFLVPYVIRFVTDKVRGE